MIAKSFIIGTSLLLIAAPAAANTGPKNTASKDPSQTEVKYCFQFDSDTGSRIRKEECRTKKEWARLGVDVDEMVRR